MFLLLGGVLILFKFIVLFSTTLLPFLCLLFFNSQYKSGTVSNDTFTTNPSHKDALEGFQNMLLGRPSLFVFHFEELLSFLTSRDTIFVLYYYRDFRQ